MLQAFGLCEIRLAIILLDFFIAFFDRMADDKTPDQAKLREASSSPSQIIPAPTARSLPKRALIDPSTLPRVLTNQVLFSTEDSMDDGDEVQESLGEASKRGAETSEEGEKLAKRGKVSWYAECCLMSKSSGCGWWLFPGSSRESGLARPPAYGTGTVEVPEPCLGWLCHVVETTPPQDTLRV